MKKVASTLLLLFVLALTASAQNVVHDKYYVGMDRSWLFLKSNPDPSIFLKIIDSKRSKAGTFSARKGYRFRLGGYFYDRKYNSEFIDLIGGRKDQGSFRFEPGYEWHKSAKIFDFFYGFDLGFYYNQQPQGFFWLIDGSTITSYDFYGRRTSFGFSPMAGLSIRIIDGINIGLESQIYCQYGRNRATLITSNPRTETEARYGTLNAGLSAISSFNILFSFR
jgi:opacity protein-like surface antigen